MCDIVASLDALQGPAAGLRSATGIAGRVLPVRHVMPMSGNTVTGAGPDIATRTAEGPAGTLPAEVARGTHSAKAQVSTSPSSLAHGRPLPQDEMLAVKEKKDDAHE